MIYLFSLAPDPGPYHGHYFYDNTKIYNVTTHFSKISNIYDVVIRENKVIYDINKSEFDYDFKSDYENPNFVYFNVYEFTDYRVADISFIKLLENEILNKIIKSV